MCHKEKFNTAYFSGSNVFNLNMETDMPGRLVHREHRQREDLCAETSLKPLGNEYGIPPRYFLNLKKSLFDPEVFAMLEAGLPQTAQAMAKAHAGSHLSASLNYLVYLIKMGEGVIKAADQISTFINQENTPNQEHQDLQAQEIQEGEPEEATLKQA